MSQKTEFFAPLSGQTLKHVTCQESCAVHDSVDPGAPDTKQEWQTWKLWAASVVLTGEFDRALKAVRDHLMEAAATDASTSLHNSGEALGGRRQRSDTKGILKSAGQSAWWR